MPPHSEGRAPLQLLSVSPVKLRQPPTEAVSAPLFLSCRMALRAIPIVSSAKVFDIKPEISGVQSSPFSVDVSCMAETAKLALKPGSSSGLVVVIFNVDPIPPVGTSALPLLYTCTDAMPSLAKLLKSKERLILSAPPVVGIWRPFSNTRLNAGPKPLTVTYLPSPRSRSIETPVILCSDSARLVSGKAPISLAVIASLTPLSERLRSMALFKL